MIKDYEENYITGWVKLYRSFVKWEWFEVPNMVTIFIYCLLKANHTDKNWRGIEVKRGSFITSLDSIKKDTGISIQSIRTCLTRLEKTSEINKVSNKAHTVITVCNYDSYQDNEKKVTKNLTINQQTANKQLTTTKNDNNDNNSNIEVDFVQIDNWINELGTNNHDEWRNNFERFMIHLKNFPQKHNNIKEFKNHLWYWTNGNIDKSLLKRYKQSGL